MMNRNYNNYNLMRNGQNFNCNNVQNNYSDYPIAMAYVPMQKFGNLYEENECLRAGTIFMELYKPFLS